MDTEPQKACYDPCTSVKSYYSSHVKYVFTDVEDFTRARGIKTQFKIIRALNRLVCQAVRRFVPEGDSKVFFPTGDGICIGILDYKGIPDPEIKIAKSLLHKLHQYNDRTKVEAERFQIRVGINENMDLVVLDSRGCRNCLGAGINEARRIMDLADGGQILVGRASYDALKQYYPNSFRHFVATVKHGVRLDVYQYVESDWLNVATPKSLEARCEHPDCGSLPEAE